MTGQKMRLYQLIIVAGLVMAIAASTQGSVIIDMRIDFSNQAAVSDANWNTINTKTTTDVPLVNFGTGDTSDGITAALLDARNRGLAKGTTTNNWQATNPGPSWLDSSQNAAKDYVSTPSNALIELDFKGLNPNLKYTIEVISSRNSSSGYDNANVPWKVIGAATSTTTQFNAYQQGYLGGQWLTWTDVSPDATGKIAIQEGSISAVTPNLFLNAARLYATPEPASLILMGLSLVGLIRRRQ